MGLEAPQAPSMNAYRRSPRGRGVLYRGRLLAIVLAFLAGILPPGMMPVWSDGGFAVIICSGGEVRTIIIGPDGAPVEPEHAQKDRCPWAAHAQPAFLTPDPNPLTAPLLRSAAYMLPLSGSVDGRERPVKPPARAPPHSL